MKRVFVLILLIILIILSACTSKDRKVNNDIIGMIQSGKFSDALTVLEQQPNYKDADVLKSFINANIKFNEVSGKEENKANFDEISKDLSAIPKDYNGELKGSIMDFKTMVNKVVQKKLDNELQTNVIALINKGQYDDAESLIVSNYKQGDEVFNALRYYGLALKNEGNVKGQMDDLAQIPLSYNGIMGDEIKKLKEKNKNIIVDLIHKGQYKEAFSLSHESAFDEELDVLYLYSGSMYEKQSKVYIPEVVNKLLDVSDKYSGVLSKEIADYKKEQQVAEKKSQDELNKSQKDIADYENRKPRIGMTADDLMKSTWGSPQKKNKTTTKYGTNEQWVYGSRYIYLEDGIVTAIQE